MYQFISSMYFTSILKSVIIIILQLILGSAVVGATNIYIVNMTIIVLVLWLQHVDVVLFQTMFGHTRKIFV